MRKPIVAGNWKMNKTHLDAIHFVQQLGHEVNPGETDKVEVVLCPPFTAIRSVQTTIDDRKHNFKWGAQNVYHEDDGAFTGEISAPMLASLRCSYVIVGHSERREIFKETDEDVNKKVKAVFRHKMIPIMCCGETDEEREAGQTESKVEGQLRNGLEGLSTEQVASLVVAYEPIWAIGTGKTATPDDAQAICSFARKIVADAVNSEAADAVRILYGGSVKSGNAAALFGRPDIDGGLVGGASLDAAEFAAIIKATPVK
ncbi:MAG: triosephosphate isomerase [Actinomycetota bacterium]|jgi:triosephosphate isomerase|nr:triosephosphate isomerase [Actinomycetota bacterium]